LRDAEATAIDWAHIDVDGGWITITEEVAKLTDDGDGTRRLIPIRGCLKAWIKDCAKKSGRFSVCVSSKAIKNCADRKVTWKRNCLRHSYSYAVAGQRHSSGGDPQWQSPAIIRKHYLQVVKPAQAAAWFNVLPVAGAEGDEKIAHLQTAN
jgi:integrase